MCWLRKEQFPPCLTLGAASLCELTHTVSCLCSQPAHTSKFLLNPKQANLLGLRFLNCGVP